MGFRARQIIALTLTATTVAVATVLINAAILVRMQVFEAQHRAELWTQSLLHLARRDLRQQTPSELRRELAEDPALRQYVDSVVGYSSTALYMALKDLDGVAILHSDPRQEGQRMARFETFAEFAERGALTQLWALGRDDQVLIAELPFNADGVPVGSAVVAVSTLLLKQQLVGAVATDALLAGGVVLLAFLGSFFIAHRLLAPVERLRAELARIDPGEGAPPLDLRTEADVGRLIEFFAAASERHAERHEAGDGAWVQTMLDRLTDAVIVLNRQRGVLSLNDNACRLLGKSRNEVEGRPIDQVLAQGHPVRSLVEETLTHDAPVRSQTVELSVEGRDVPYLLSAHVLREGDRTFGVMLTARDVQRLSRLGSRLSYAQKLAALGRLTSGVAHEIKNPLNALVIQVALLRQKLGESHPDARRHLDVLEDEVKRLDRVVQGFMKFTRPEEIQLESVRLDKIVEEALELMAARAEQQGIRLETHVPQQLPAVQGSAELLRQVLLNLINNAIDAMPGGGLLRVRAEPSTEGSILLTLEDTGEGIPAADLARVFDLFYTTKSGGSGIGLSMAYRIIQLHGGEIRVDSERGAGTRVTMTLPEVAV